MQSLDSFKCRKTLKVGNKSYVYFSLTAAEKNGLKGISKLPYSMRVLLENLLRYEDGQTVTRDDILAVADWAQTRTSDREIAAGRGLQFAYRGGVETAFESGVGS